MKEIWKDIEGYEGLYQVSNLGQVKSLERTIIVKNCKQSKTYPECIKIPFPNKKGYLRVQLYKNNKRRNLRVHRLVALAFIPNPDNKPKVNHIDGDPTNNVVSNLEWVTGEENRAHQRLLEKGKATSKKPF